MINYFDLYKTSHEDIKAFNQQQGMSLEGIAKKNDRDCIDNKKCYKYEALSNASYMSRLKEISESQLIGYK